MDVFFQSVSVKKSLIPVSCDLKVITRSYSQLTLRSSSLRADETQCPVFQCHQLVQSTHLFDKYSLCLSADDTQHLFSLISGSSNGLFPHMFSAMQMISL